MDFKLTLAAFDPPDTEPEHKSETGKLRNSGVTMSAYKNDNNCKENTANAKKNAKEFEL